MTTLQVHSVSGRLGRRVFGALLLLWGCLASAFGAGTRETISLNTGWRFMRQTNPGSEVEWPLRDAWRPEFDDSKWATVFVPHSWDQTADGPWPAANHWRGIGWYRQSFLAPQAAAGHKVFLEFEGTFQVTRVWLNGKEVGGHTGGFTGFFVDVTGAIEPGKRNLLALSVDSTNNPNIPPANESNVTTFGGLYRDVWLHIMATTYIPDGEISITTPEVSTRSSRVHVQTGVMNSTAAPAEIRLVSSILSSSGQVVAESTATSRAAPHGMVQFAQDDLVVVQPALWHPDHPNLYTLRSRVYRDGVLADEFPTRFGIRQFGYVAQKGYTINGEFINLHGVNRRQDYGYLGDALPDAVSRHDMEIIKELGANLVRTSHYIQDKSVIEAADELGLVIWEEIPNIKIYDYSPTAAPNKDTRYTRKYIENCLVAAQEMIRRDRNHASIAIWGIGDDLTGYPYIEDLQEMNDRVHELDPTRWTAGRVYPFITDVHDPTNGAYFHFRELAQQHPDWKWLWNEWGAFVNERGIDIEPSQASVGRTDTGNVDLYRPDSIPSEITGAMFQEASWLQFESMPWMASTKWVMFDPSSTNMSTKGIFYFYGPPEKRPWGVRFSGGDYRGLSDLWRIPKASYWFMRAQWTEDPFVYIVAHWTWPGTEGKPHMVRIYSTCDEVELFLNGKSLGKRQPATTEELQAEWGKYRLGGGRNIPPGTKLKHAPFVWRDVPYEPGVLKAVGTRNGKQYTDERVTAGAPDQIILRPDRDHIASGGRDAVRIVATIADEHGVMVPSANPWLSFQVSGPGDLLGTPVLDAVWGMAAINVQSRAEGGDLIVTAAPRGIKIKQGQCRIVSAPPAK